MGQWAAMLCSCPRALDIFHAYSISQLLLSALADGCDMLGLQLDSSREPAVESCAGAGALFLDLGSVLFLKIPKNSMSYLTVILQFPFGLGWPDWVLLFETKNPEQCKWV